MRSSFKRSVLDSAPCQSLGGGARRHPRPSIDVPCAGRQAPARLSSTVDRIKSTHTNRSPINPVHFKVAIYARYSSDNQREASIADQLRICREVARKQGWTIAKEYSDAAVSGATLLRSGFQAMMSSALRNDVDVVLAESLDRFSRDQEDTAGLFKRLTFAGVSIVTLAKGDITFLHIGLKGTMNAMYLKELLDKTRRGLRGRMELGKAGGGISFGYRIVRTFENGVVSTGDRAIVPEEADLIRRVFKDYVGGKSPKQIAKDLNREGLRGPRGALWSSSTIHGNPKRGIGILHNELYIAPLDVSRAVPKSL
jgi:site-specific DNA recombinase